VALCVAVALLALLVAGLALWRSHEALDTAMRAERAGGTSATMQAAIERMLAQEEARATADDEGGAASVAESSGATASTSEDASVASPSDAVLAANGEPILAQSADVSAPVAAPRHKWDGPRAPEPEPGAIIPWDEAAGHYSRTITVEGEVVETGRGRNGTPVYLNFQEYSPDSKAFHIVVFEDGFANAPGGDPHGYYEGKTIRVTGEVGQYRDAPQIKVEGPGMIEVVEE